MLKSYTAPLVRIANAPDGPTENGRTLPTQHGCTRVGGRGGLKHRAIDAVHIRTLFAHMKVTELRGP